MRSRHRFTSRKRCTKHGVYGATLSILFWVWRAGSMCLGVMMLLSVSSLLKRDHRGWGQSFFLERLGYSHRLDIDQTSFRMRKSRNRTFNCRGTELKCPVELPSRISGPETSGFRYRRRVRSRTGVGLQFSCSSYDYDYEVPSMPVAIN